MKLTEAERRLAERVGEGGEGFVLARRKDPTLHLTDYLKSHEDGGGEQLRGAALDEALTEAGLSRAGTVDEKRARLAEHQEANQ